MKKIRLIYDPIHGITFPDGKCESTAINLITSFRGGKLEDFYTLVFSNALFFDAFRVEIKKGLIKPEEIEVYFKDGYNLIKIPIDKDGRCAIWPKGFCDYMENFLIQL